MERQRISEEFHPSSISFNHFPLLFFFFSFIFTKLWIILYLLFHRKTLVATFLNSDFPIIPSFLFFYLSFFSIRKITKLFAFPKYLFPRPSPRSLKGTRLSRDSVGSSCGRRTVRCVAPRFPPPPSCPQLQGNPPATPVHYGVGWVS